MTDTLAATAQIPAVGLPVAHRRRARLGGEPTVRVHLDAEDLAKTQVRSGGGPFTEALFSLRSLRARRPNALATAWVRQTRPALQATNIPLAALSLVEHLVDLHTMVLQAPSTRDALRQLTTGSIEPLPGTDPALAGADSAPASVQSWLRGLREGDERAVGVMAQMFFEYHRHAIDPHWKSIRSHLEAVRSRSGNIVTKGGLDRLLTTLHPKVRWRPPVLEVSVELEGPPAERSGRLLDMAHHGRPGHVLDGRWLVLVPSVFCLDGPRVLWSHRDPTLPIVLVYPALHRMADAAALWTPGRVRDPSALARLLGRTQAAVLTAVADTCTTTTLADRVGISLPTASHHTSILRGAGLVMSRRSGNTVVHRLTPLGADLLGAAT